MSEHKPKAVYQIIENEKLAKPIWRRIGTAFVNRDQSLHVIMESVPLIGTVHIRDLPEKPENDSTREAA